MYKNLPVIVGFPRSGNHWITGLLEMYFNTRRYNKAEFCFCSENIKNNYLFYGTHDLNSDEKFDHNNILYLYRSPVNCLFSYFIAEQKQFSKIGELNEKEFVYGKIQSLILHYKKYFFSDLSKEFIRYEYLQANFLYEFDKLVKFFNEDLNIQKANEINQKLTKDFTIDYIIKSSSSKIGNNYINKDMLTLEYEKERSRFSWLYGSYIFNVLIEEFGYNKLSIFFKEI